MGGEERFWTITACEADKQAIINKPQYLRPPATYPTHSKEESIELEREASKIVRSTSSQQHTKTENRWLDCQATADL